LRDRGELQLVYTEKREVTMTARAGFSTEEARRIGEEIGIDWDTSPFEVDEFRRGMDVELEHGLHDLATNVTDDDPVTTARSPGRI